MSSRRRSRGSKPGNTATGASNIQGGTNTTTSGGGKGKGRSRSSQRNRRNRSRQRRQRQDGADFWGETSKLPPIGTDVAITDHPGAVPRSLGQPPLPGHETIAEHYFDVVYERAVTTAGALAAAGGLIDPASLVNDADGD